MTIKSRTSKSKPGGMYAAGGGRSIPQPSKPSAPVGPRSIPQDVPQTPTFGPRTTEERPITPDAFGPRSIPDPNRDKPLPKPAGPDFTKSNEMMSRAEAAYKSGNFSYDPFLQTQGAQYEGQDFNPYANAAQTAADAAAGAGYQGMQNQLLAQGPMSAADRMNLVSQFNRAKITGNLGANAQVSGMRNQNQMGVGQQNLLQSSQMNRANVGASNAAMQQGAKAEQARLQNLYQTAKADELLAKKMAASRDIAKAGASSGDIFSQIFGG